MCDLEREQGARNVVFIDMSWFNRAFITKRIKSMTVCFSARNHLAHKGIRVTIL